MMLPWNFDRSGDPLKHGNSAGSAPQGGVLLLAGDDHTCKSSTLAHQSELAFIDAMRPTAVVAIVVLLVAAASCVFIAMVRRPRVVSEAVIVAAAD